MDEGKKLNTDILEPAGIDVDSIKATRQALDSKDNIKRFVQNEGDVFTSLKMLDDGIISDINIADSDLGNYTLLMYQVFHGTLRGVKSLLIHDPPALPNLQDSTGWTALHLAVIIEDPNKVRLLLDYGADKTIKGKNGKTALDLAKGFEDINCIDSLENYVPNSRVGGARRKKSKKSRKSKKSKKSKKSRKSRK